MRYSKLGYVALNVSDLDRSRAFYRDMVGLQPSGEGKDGALFFRCGVDHHTLALYRGEAPGLRRIGLEMESEEELGAAFEGLKAAGVQPRWLEPAEAAALHVGRAFRFTEPSSGAVYDYYSVMSQFAIEPYRPTVAKIVRLGHVVMKVKAYDEAVAFATGPLNFRVSDHVRDRLTFMRCFPNPYHHGIALARGDAPQLHHFNFMVTEIDDIGRALGRFKKHDIPMVYGPGRHPSSDSIFLYFLDPDGLTVEYSFGMEEFPEAGARKPRMFEPVEALDTWGLPRDPRFATIGAIRG